MLGGALRLQWRQLGVGATARVIVTRSGWLVPKWDVVPARKYAERATDPRAVAAEARARVCPCGLDTWAGSRNCLHRDVEDSPCDLVMRRPIVPAWRDSWWPGQPESASLPIGIGTPLRLEQPPEGPK